MSKGKKSIIKILGSKSSLILPLSLGFLALVLVWKFINRNKVTSQQDAANSLVNDIDVDYNQINDRTYLNTLTEKLYAAMDRFGTDEDTIFQVFESVTGEEIKYIFKRFGVRRYAGGAHALVIGNDLTLSGWLLKELTKKEYEKLKVILINKGVQIL